MVGPCFRSSFCKRNERSSTSWSRSGLASTESAYRASARAASASSARADSMVRAQEASAPSIAAA